VGGVRRSGLIASVPFRLAIAVTLWNSVNGV
jgi:hypothetical protein